MRHRLLPLCVLAALAVTAGGCNDGGGGGDGAGSSAARSAPGGSRTQLVKANEFGVLSVRRRVVYGALEGDSAVRLGGQTGGTVIARRAWRGMRLDGRFVAYETLSRNGTAHVDVFDLHSRQLVLDEPAHSRGVRTRVTSLSLKRNGSVAWIAGAVRPQGEAYEVHEASVPLGRNRLLDSGPGIGPTSLGLSFYELDVFWTDRSRPRTAPFS